MWDDEIIIDRTNSWDVLSVLHRVRTRLLAGDQPELPTRPQWHQTPGAGHQHHQRCVHVCLLSVCVKALMGLLVSARLFSCAVSCISSCFYASLCGIRGGLSFFLLLLWLLVRPRKDRQPVIHSCSGASHCTCGRVWRRRRRPHHPAERRSRGETGVKPGWRVELYWTLVGIDSSGVEEEEEDAAPQPCCFY